MKEKLKEFLTLSEPLIDYVILDLDRWHTRVGKTYKDAQRCKELIEELKVELDNIKSKSEINYQK